MLILSLKTKNTRPKTSIMGGVEVVFTQWYTSDGAVALVGEVEDKHPEIEVVRRIVRAMPSHYMVVTREALAAPAVEVDAPRAQDVAQEAPRGLPWQLALSNGWEPQDLLGAGQGDNWGPEGGRAQVSGLTVSEMALSIPPPGWSSVREHVWPWEIEGWTPPGASGWKHPRVPPKAGTEAQAPDPDQSDEEQAPEPASSTKPKPKAKRKPKPQPKPKPKAQAQEAPAELSVLIPESLIGFPGIEDSVALIVELFQKKSVWPTISKFKWHAKRRGLPALTTAELALLRDHLLPTLSGE